MARGPTVSPAGTCAGSRATAHGEPPGKKAVIERLTGNNTVALLQETHWDGEAEAFWTSWLFAHTDIVSSPARDGPLGGLQGGVAILCPHPAKIIAHRIIVPGCIIEATIDRGDGRPPEAYISTYIPPGCLTEVLDTLDRTDPPGCGKVMGGDLNFDTDGPRDPEEDKAATLLHATLERWGMALIDNVHPTHRDCHGARKIDFLATDRNQAPLWRIQLKWHPALSDHALILGRS